MVLSRSLLYDLPPLDHSIDTYSFRRRWTGVWAGIFAVSLLLLLLLLHDPTSDTRRIESTMGVSEVNRNGPVGTVAGAIDMEHE